ncbi:MAG: VOC family protein [Pseudomonadales bacterium]
MSKAILGGRMDRGLDEAKVSQVGYAVVGTKSEDEWVDLATTVGCEIVKVSSGRGLRLDPDRAARIFLDENVPTGSIRLGWEAPDASAYAAILHRLDDAGALVQRDDEALAAQRSVQQLAVFKDPDGITGELYWGAHSALRAPFRSPFHVSFRAGSEGFGHATLAVANEKQTTSFYVDVLGLMITELADVGDLRVVFLRANSRHHSLALAQMPSGKSAVAHLMLEVERIDDLGSIRDRLLQDGQRIARDLGRHPTDGVISMYLNTPEHYELEIGWGSETVADDWEEVRYARNSWSWGHHRIDESGAPIVVAGSGLGEEANKTTDGD